MAESPWQEQSHPGRLGLRSGSRSLPGQDIPLLSISDSTALDRSHETLERIGSTKNHPSSRRPFNFGWKDGASLAGPQLRYIGWKQAWLSIAWWCLTAGLVIYCWTILRSVQSPSSTIIYGFVRRSRGPCSSYTAVTLAVNVAASVVVAASDHFKTGLIAPTPKVLQNWATSGTGDVGVESIQGFRAAAWSKKIIFLVLLITSIPLHFLSNSILILEEWVPDSYEVLLSASFFDGKAFNISSLNMTQFVRPEAAHLPSPDAKWPEDYWNVSQLTEDLFHLDDQGSSWKKLSPKDCVDAYSQPAYKNYRTLLLITDSKTPDDNNSALAISVLPGYRMSSLASSVLALCPDAYLRAYGDAQKPANPPYLVTTSSYPEPAFYIDPSEAERLAIHSTDLSRDKYGHDPRADGPWPAPLHPSVSRMAALLSEKNTLPDFDLCYHYWDIRFKLDTNEYIRPPCNWSYCLAQPHVDKTCDADLSPTVLYVTTICLTIKFGAMTLALFLRCTSLVFTRWNDALDHFVEHRGTYGELQPGHLKGGQVHLWVAMHFVILGYSCGLFASTARPFVRAVPLSISDTSWYLKPVAFYRALHVFYDVNNYLEQNIIYGHVSIREFHNFVACADHRTSLETEEHSKSKVKTLKDKNIKTSIKNIKASSRAKVIKFKDKITKVSIKKIQASSIAKLRAFRALFRDILIPLAIVFPLRSALLHFLVSFVFTVRFQMIESLGKGAQQLPVVFASFGLYTYGNWLLFLFIGGIFLILFPPILLLGTYYGAKGIRWLAGGPWKI